MCPGKKGSTCPAPAPVHCGRAACPIKRSPGWKEQQHYNIMVRTVPLSHRLLKHRITHSHQVLLLYINIEVESSAISPSFNPTSFRTGRQTLKHNFHLKEISMNFFPLVLIALFLLNPFDYWPRSVSGEVCIVRSYHIRSQLMSRR